MPVDLTKRARTGDEDAFRELTEPYRNELHLHCYRMLGSFHDAEDALQETLLAAWRALPSFEGRSSLRTWLYRVATSRCLNLRRSSGRRVPAEIRISEPNLPPPTRTGEVRWLEPYPDTLLDTLADGAPGPEARYETREAVSLAFITALQLLPPRQRAVAILRDVLGYHAREVADLLDTTEESVTSALKRARATLPVSAPAEPVPLPRSAAERDLIERFTCAFEADDVEAVVRLLTEDVRCTMPPLPFEWLGQDAARQCLLAMQIPGRRLLATRANAQPAFGLYLPGPRAKVLHAAALLVLGLRRDRVAAITHFETVPLTHFGLPRTVRPRDRGAG